jgi:hypothetical protein
MNAVGAGLKELRRLGLDPPMSQRIKTNVLIKRVIILGAKMLIGTI